MYVHTFYEYCTHISLATKHYNNLPTYPSSLTLSIYIYGSIHLYLCYYIYNIAVAHKLLLLFWVIVFNLDSVCKYYIHIIYLGVVVIQLMYVYICICTSKHIKWYKK